MPNVTYNGVSAKVNEAQQLTVRAISEDHIAYESQVNKHGFLWSTGALDLGADKNVIWMRNDSSLYDLRFFRTSVYCASTALIEVYTGSGNTVGGTVVPGENFYIGQPACQVVTCRHTNTNVDTGTGMTLFSTHRVGATNEEVLEFDGALVIPINQEFAVNIVTDIAETIVNVAGYLDPISNR